MLFNILINPIIHNMILGRVGESTPINGQYWGKVKLRHFSRHGDHALIDIEDQNIEIVEVKDVLKKVFYENTNIYSNSESMNITL